MPGHLHVLVVDERKDDPDAIAPLLSRSGCAAVCRRVPTAEALFKALLAGDEVDMVLCDSMPPHFDVWRTVAVVHDVRPNLPIVVVSDRRGADIEEALASGDVSCVLSKDRIGDLPALVRGLFGTPNRPL